MQKQRAALRVAVGGGKAPAAQKWEAAQQVLRVIRFCKGYTVSSARMAGAGEPERHVSRASAQAALLMRFAVAARSS